MNMKKSVKVNKNPIGKPVKGKAPVVGTSKKKMVKKSK